MAREGAGVVGGWTADQGPFTPRMRAGESAMVTLGLSLNVNAGGYHLDVAIARRDWTALQCSQDRVYRFGVLGRPGNTHLVDLAPSVEIASEFTAVIG